MLVRVPLAPFQRLGAPFRVRETKPRARPRRFSRWAGFALVALPLAGVLAFGCGPSVQSIYEGNVRFEHCYRLDLDLNIAPSHREACWRQWLKNYTYGQPRDRTEYARRRLRAFMAGDLSRPALNLGTERRPEDRQFYLVVPNPTSVRAPPPPIATRMYAGEQAPPPAPEPPKEPHADCANDCSSAWKSCQRACGPDGGASEMACRSCEPDYKACMRRCFE